MILLEEVNIITKKIFKKGYLSITDVLGLTENVVKDFKLYFDGEESGDLNLTYTFKTAEP